MAFRSETWVIFRESSARDPRKPARKRRLRLQGEVLSERRASQYTSLVLETCDFKLELHGLRKAATFQPVHVMYYPCDEKLRLYSWSWGIAFRALRWHLKAAIF